MTTRERSLGDRGEAFACKYLERKGLKLVERNFHAQGGELDLIMHDKNLDEYVLVEVKTRTSDRFGTGLEAITQSKLEKMLRAAEDFFVKKLDLEQIPFFRIDAVIVTVKKGVPEVEHYVGVGGE